MKRPEVEDILNDSLVCLGEQPAQENNTFQYGPLVLEIASKEGKAISLLADQLFSPALYLAERIERGHLNVAGSNVIELGAGSGLPSMLMATVTDHPTLTVATDYPDDHIIGNLRRNIERNRPTFQPASRIECIGYEWGCNVEPLLKLLPSSSHENRPGYDIVVLSDLLHFNDSHDDLISSTTSLLHLSENSKVHISAGKYTRPEVCENFLREGRKAGLEFNEVYSDFDEAEWKGTMEVGGLNKDALARRKANCRYWIGRWSKTYMRDRLDTISMV